MPELFIDVAVPVAVDSLFTYRVPEEFQPLVQPGIRVVVPFGRRTVVGVVTALEHSSPRARLKSVSDVLDASPILSPELLALARWIAEYYFAPLGEVIKAMLVQGATRPGRRKIRLLPHASSAEISKTQAKIIDVLHGTSVVALPELQRRTGIRSIAAPLAGLLAQGIIAVEDEAPGAAMRPKRERVIVVDEQWKQRWSAWLAPARRKRAAERILEALGTHAEAAVPVTQILREARSSSSALATLRKEELVELGWREVLRAPDALSEEPAPAFALNPDQVAALEQLHDAVAAQTFRTFLLYGVTGSGKTQVYIEAIRDAITRGSTAIVLVPEISLTPQTVRRFRQHFGEKVIALHSRMSPGERYDAWRMIRSGAYAVVIGPRSAVFAPLKNIGLIVVDEEHEASYKQFDQTPRYHARDVAIVRASKLGAVVVLGSATPSLESFTNARSGKYTLLRLPVRADNARLPRVEIVDLGKERREKFQDYRNGRKEAFRIDAAAARAEGATFKASMISDKLRENIADRLGRREGIILLQNRRGFAPFIECPECGHVERCEHCSISLTFHLPLRQLRCHYCGLVKHAPEVCPECSSLQIKYLGYGTQRVEQELLEIFPDARLLRMDLDTTTGKGSHDTMLQAFARGDADILLGTQMVAKGLDFSRVTLVGVISADTQMLLPDFRSAERTFQLLTQVAGRSGRSRLEGEVVIQTLQPAHAVLKHVLRHDYDSFYEEELAYRAELDYPPYARIILLECRGAAEERVRTAAAALAQSLRDGRRGYLVLGPAPAAITRLKNLYRWHILLKDLKQPSGSTLQRNLRAAVAAFRASGDSRAVQLIIDVDPQGMM